MPKIGYGRHSHTGSSQENRISPSGDRLSGFQENINTVNTTDSSASK